MILAGIEAGGTKFIAGLFHMDSPDCKRPTLLCRRRIPTDGPRETLGAVVSYLREAAAEHGAPDALGIGCFGPVELRLTSPHWGQIRNTPKAGWEGVSVAGFLQEELKLPVAFDTDVNAAAFGEYLWGEARGLKDFIYLTVGTGIGGGIFSSGTLVHGLGHPELGHLKLAREARDTFPGSCPYHGDCLEGLAAGPAVAARWGLRGEELPPEHPAWELEARYLARAAAAYACVVAPERILLGGGIGLRPGLAERVNELLREELGGYLATLEAPEFAHRFVRRPGLGAEAGFYGAAALALRLRSD